MDRLYDTLEHRIKTWEKKMKRSTGISGKLFDRKGAKKNELLESQLVAAFDLSAALDYLHKREILYRDLKPENVGFDIVSIFFARILVLVSNLLGYPFLSFIINTITRDHSAMISRSSTLDLPRSFAQRISKPMEITN